jgi:pimeloyl-ACP methyl ester carboxylesterase
MRVPREAVEGYALEYEVVRHPGAAREPIVFLHHGFGSISTWKDFPTQVGQRLGRDVLIYARAGCGSSDPLRGLRTGSYLFNEAETVLPQLLDRLGLDRVVVFGHSDGATISLLFAAAFPNRVVAAVIEAPHVIIEEITVEGVAEVARRYEQDAAFRERVAQHHADPYGAFWSWATVWLDPAQRSWSMVDRLGQVRCPLLLVQGDQDPYATLKQLDLIEEHVAGPAERLVLAGCGHGPHVEGPEEVIEATRRLLDQAASA